MDGVCFGDLQYVLYDTYINLNIIRQLRKPIEKIGIGEPSPEAFFLFEKLIC